MTFELVHCTACHRVYDGHGICCVKCNHEPAVIGDYIREMRTWVTSGTALSVRLDKIDELLYNQEIHTNNMVNKLEWMDREINELIRDN